MSDKIILNYLSNSGTQNIIRIFWIQLVVNGRICLVLSVQAITCNVCDLFPAYSNHVTFTMQLTHQYNEDRSSSNYDFKRYFPYHFACGILTKKNVLSTYIIQNVQQVWLLQICTQYENIVCICMHVQSHSIDSIFTIE